MKDKRRKQEVATGDFGAFASHRTVGSMLGIGRESQERVLAELQSRQDENGFVSRSAIEEVAGQTSVSSACVHGVGSFYSMLDVRAVEPTQPTAKKQMVRVCDGPSCCLTGGSQFVSKVCDLTNNNPGVRVERTSCIGQCDRAPALLIDNQPLGPASLETIKESLFGPQIHKTDEPRTSKFSNSTLALDGAAQRPLTKRFGRIDPWSLESAINASAYDALQKAISLPSSTVIDSVEASGLRGRGGAGFNTGRKWRMASETDSPKRYVVCNADESEPGTFKDRALMENDPHLLLEGMAICAKAVGADEGVIYIRGEYSEAAILLEHAIAEARESGFLGNQICGSTFSFDVHVHRGAGAYICGEETALLESLEGKRGEPRERPPFPTVSGFRGMPTVVNNVETLCAVPFIIQHGADAYRRLGLKNSAGTKLFCLSGHVARPGVYEAPMGLPLRDAIENLGGGIAGDGRFKFALTGGAAGTFVPKSLLDIPLCYESWDEGVAIGSGAIIVADHTVSAASMLKWLIHFFEMESCGKCTPCRIGTCQAQKLAARFADGNGRDGDIERLLQLATLLDRTSFCGLGQSVAWPIESAIRHFRDDFREQEAKSSHSGDK